MKEIRYIEWGQKMLMALVSKLLPTILIDGSRQPEESRNGIDHTEEEKVRKVIIK